MRDLRNVQLAKAGPIGIANAEARWKKPLSEMTDTGLMIGREEAIARRRRRWGSIETWFPPEYYAFSAEENLRCDAEREKQRKHAMEAFKAFMDMPKKAAE